MIHAIIAIDYREPVGDEVYEDGDYYGVIIRLYENGGLEDKQRYMTGDVVADFKAALATAEATTTLISLSSTVHNFISDSGIYDFESEDSILIGAKQ